MIRFLPVIAARPNLPSSRRGRSPRPRLFRCIGQAHATEPIAECIRGGRVREAESNIGLLALVSAPAAADRDAALTVKRVKVQENTAEASGRKGEFDQMREVAFV